MRQVNNPRVLAFEVLAEVELKNEYSNLLLPKYLASSQMSKSDKALATELVYGTLRMKGLYDHFIQRVSDRDLVAIDAKALIVLRMGIHQLKQMRTPTHAAIFESVELGKRVLGRSTASFVNAVLRRVSEMESIQWQGDEVSKLAGEYSHPEWIVSSYLDSLKDVEQVVNLLIANNSPAKPTLIAWPGQSTKDELIDGGATDLVGSQNAVSYDGNPGDLPAVRERRAGVQDYGSQLLVEELFKSFAGNLRWLDLCAGPGGKAAYLSALLSQKGGEFVANEVSEARANLVKQVVKYGSVTNFDGRELPDSIGTFDRILIDAPCTGIGALRRRPEVRWRRTVQGLKELVELQSELLDSAADKVNPYGVIAYATCSPHQAETVFQVRSFLKRHPEFEIRPITHPRADKDGLLQLWTHKDNCDAMFLALLQKKG
ncbi:MAG: tRNA/rRNA cytosine-C5-methylase [Candidatus Nanopelagicaceae bacterium]|nr:tRNA/rRNA cytosine-C5-methylase [Candidatus Nanopelagicaceae bacterium]